MPHKGKVAAEEKVRAVEDYLSGKKSPGTICATLGIHTITLRRWTRLYEIRGAAGLIPAQKEKKYSMSLKTQAVEEYLAGGVSYEEICSKYDVSDTRIVGKWVKKYNSRVGFKEPNTGGEIYMA